MSLVNSQTLKNMSSKTGVSQERRRDVISEFPDEILCHILSFLPSSEAVRAGILSSRWRNLWASLPNLDVEDSFISRIRGKNKRKQQEIKKSFLKYVDSMIKRDDIMAFPRLRFCCSMLPTEVVSSWVLAVVRNNVRHLELCFRGEMMTLPPKLFTLTSLEVLKLEADQLVITDSICLPNLKVFHIDFEVFGNYVDLDVLLSNCPVLEELSIKRKVVGMKKSTFNISFPKLKKLYMEFIDENAWERYKLVLNGPNLEYLYLKDYHTMDFEVMNLGSLSKACIDWKPKFHGSETSDAFCGQITELMKGIAEVKSLSLTNHVVLFLNNAVDFGLPVFSNLKHLELDVAGVGCQFLARILPCTPRIEILVLLNKGEASIDYWEDWSPPDEVPECLLLHLKQILLSGFCLDYDASNVVQYLMEHSRVLSKMTVECGYSATEEDTRGFYEELTRSSCGSETCHIMLVSKDGVCLDQQLL